MIKRNFEVLKAMVSKMDKDLIKEEWQNYEGIYKYAVKAPFYDTIRFSTVEEIRDWVENELLKNDAVWNVPESEMRIYYRHDEMRK